MKKIILTLLVFSFIFFSVEVNDNRIETNEINYEENMKLWQEQDSELENSLISYWDRVDVERELNRAITASESEIKANMAIYDKYIFR